MKALIAGGSSAASGQQLTDVPPGFKEIEATSGIKRATDYRPDSDKSTDFQKR